VIDRGRPDARQKGTRGPADQSSSGKEYSSRRMSWPGLLAAGASNRSLFFSLLRRFAFIGHTRLVAILSNRRVRKKFPKRKNNGATTPFRSNPSDGAATMTQARAFRAVHPIRRRWPLAESLGRSLVRVSLPRPRAPGSAPGLDSGHDIPPADPVNANCFTRITDVGLMGLSQRERIERHWSDSGVFRPAFGALMKTKNL